MVRVIFSLLFLVALSLTACTSDATLTAPPLDEASVEREAPSDLMRADFRQTPVSALVTLRGRIRHFNGRRGQADVVFEGTTSEGQPIRGRGQMRFSGSREGSTLTVEQAHVRFRGMVGDGELEQPVRSRGFIDVSEYVGILEAGNQLAQGIVVEVDSWVAYESWPKQ